MLEKRCPNLGLMNDPDTAMAFPNGQNCCHRANPVEAVDLNHQDTYCFSGKHQQCLVFTRAKEGPLPKDIQANPPESISRGLLISGAVFAATIVLGIVLVFGWWQGEDGNRLWALGQDTGVNGNQADNQAFTMPTQQALTPTITPTDIFHDLLINLPSATSVLENVLCPIPEDWIPYIISEGDTLKSIAITVDASAQELLDGNCLANAALAAGMIIFVPPSPTETPTVFLTDVPVIADTPIPIDCTIPENWVLYIVQPGDTLYKLSLLINVSMDDLVTGNCLESTNIWVGQRIYLPLLPAIATPAPTATPTLKATRSTVPTATPVPTNTPLPTSTPTPDILVTIPPLVTATPSQTVPPSPTATLPPPPTATFTPIPLQPTPTPGGGG